MTYSNIQPRIFEQLWVVEYGVLSQQTSENTVVVLVWNDGEARRNRTSCY